MPTLHMVAVGYDHPDSQRLIDEVQQEYIERYGGIDRTPLDSAQFTQPNGLFIVGYLDGQPVATGAWRRPDAEHMGANWASWDLAQKPLAEIKRMFVSRSVRGLGLSRLMLAELERTAAAAGIEWMVLETGTMQPEAIALYTSSGYEPVAGFGFHCGDALARHFGRKL